MFDEESLEQRMARIRLQNAEILKRHMEVQADKEKAARNKALVDTHANVDVDEMTPAERVTTIESRCRKPHKKENNSMEDLQRDSFNSHPRHQSHNRRKSLDMPEPRRIDRKLTQRASGTLQEHTAQWDDTSDLSGPFNIPPGLVFNFDEVDVPCLEEPARTSPPLQFDPDMDLSVPPPPIVRSQIYGSGRLPKSRLNQASNLPGILLDQQLGQIESQIFSVGVFEPDTFSSFQFSSVNEIAQALNDCEKNQAGGYQSNPQQAEPNLAQPSHQCTYKNETYRKEPAKDGFPEIGNFEPVLPKSTPSDQPKPRKKSALELRMAAVRQETCKRFSRSQYLQNNKSGTVDISFITNTPVNY